jgi:predicted ferric reductase
MIGNYSIIFSVLITVILFFIAKIGTSEPIRIFTFLAQITGLLGSVLISFNFILATRNKLVEKAFNGLDKAYKVHNLLGNIAFILVVNHPLFLIINSLPFNTTKLYLVPTLTNLPYTFGILALYSLIILVALTIFVDLPYKIWKRTHEVMGLVIIFGSLHSFLITSDMSVYLPLKVWILGLNILAIIAYVYKRYFYYLIRPKNNYVVQSIEHDKNYLLINLVATNLEKYIEFKPGQYAFFSLQNDTRDEHPFSILEQDGPNLRIGTKVVGKFTLDLTQLKKGIEVNVNGPFGSFASNMDRANEMVWISGGIGITPFLSMIKKLKTHQKVTMIHSSKNNEPALFTKLFKDYTYFFPNFKFIVHYPSLDGRLNEENINKYVELTSQSYVYLCGPKEMMDTFSQKLPKKGIKQKRIIYEDFTLK